MWCLSGWAARRRACEDSTRVGCLLGPRPLAGLLPRPARAGLRDRGAGSAGAVGEILGTGDAQVEWADLALPDGRVLELLRLPGGPPSAGSGHFALGVADAEALHGRLREAGVPLRSEPVTIDDAGDWQGARCFYAEDPDGTVVELIERTSARS
jgi:catechol 2,3-dioxygenase-like lactoylglutathione lyase family enzyme